MFKLLKLICNPLPNLFHHCITKIWEYHRRHLFEGNFVELLLWFITIIIILIFKVLLDGNDLKDLNTNWLRNNIGVVSQEPILFGMTIAENIKLGNPDVTTQEIEEAAKAANAHDFIQQLPNVRMQTTALLHTIHVTVPFENR
jgi:hypothetical protein